MKRSVFCTTAPLKTSHGGGNVSVHELNALLRVTDVEGIYSAENNKPESYNRGTEFNPFLADYFTYFQVKKHDPDLMFFNGNPWGLTASIRWRDQFIISDVPAHNMDESMKEHQLLNMPYVYPHLTDPVVREYYLRHIKASDKVWCPSTYSGNYLVTKFDVKSILIEVIPHGCNAPAIVPQLPENFAVGTLGVNGVDKGHIYLYKASTLANKFVSFVGMGTEAYGGIPFVNNVSDYYAGLSAYVQPSVADGFGIPVLEAMSHGRPVIVTEGVGAKDLVHDGYTGFVVPIRSPEAIADNIIYFRDNPSEVKRMGENARATALHYTWDNIEKIYEKKIKEVIGEA